MALDTGGYTGYPALLNCFPQHQVPVLTGSGLPSSQLQSGYPYMFSEWQMENLYRNSVFALKQVGFFSSSSGFKKLGYLYRSCVAGIPQEFQGWLHQAGVPASEIVGYDIGCPATLIPSPTDIQQAVLTFRQAGVTNVTDTQGDIADFSNDAAQQGYKPNYGLPRRRRAAHQLRHQPSQLGQHRRSNPHHEPGVRRRAHTRLCPERHHRAMRCRDEGTRPSVHLHDCGGGQGQAEGLACNEMWLLAAMADHASVLQRTALASGLQNAKSVPLSYPWGPDDFSGSRVTYGGEFWRTVAASASCKCWHIVDKTWHASFPGG